MADRRRRRRTSTESELSEEEDSPNPRSSTDKVADRDCESEFTQGEETSEYESTTEGPDDDDETETEDEDDDETTEDYEDDQEDVILEDDWIEEERQSGDGEEEPDKHEDLDDDEDKKNPAYIPRKGAFYEHDTRMSLDAKEEDTTEADGKEQSKPKQALWQDHQRWDHDKFSSDQQAPKSREELIAIYGYDIRSHDKPPEGVPRGRRNRRPDRTRELRDYMPAGNEGGYRGGQDRPSYGRGRGGRGGRGGPRPRPQDGGNRDNRSSYYSDFKNTQAQDGGGRRDDYKDSPPQGRGRRGYTKPPTPEHEASPPPSRKTLDFQSKGMPPDVVPKSHIIEAYHADLSDGRPNQYNNDQPTRSRFRKGFEDRGSNSDVSNNRNDQYAKDNNRNREQPGRDSGYRKDGPRTNYNNRDNSYNKSEKSGRQGNDSYNRNNQRGGFGNPNSNRGSMSNSNRGSYGGGNNMNRGNYIREGGGRNPDFIESNRGRNDSNRSSQPGGRDNYNRDRQGDDPRQYDRRARYGQLPKSENYDDDQQSRPNPQNIRPLMKDEQPLKPAPGGNTQQHAPPTTANVKAITSEAAKMSIYPPVTSHLVTASAPSALEKKQSNTAPQAKAADSRAEQNTQNRPKRYSRQRPMPETGNYGNEGAPEGAKSGPPQGQGQGQGQQQQGPPEGYFPRPVYNPQTGVFVSPRPTVTQSPPRSANFPHPPLIQPPLTNIPFTSPPSTMVQSPPRMHIQPRATVAPVTMSPSAATPASQPVIQGQYVAAPIVNYGPPHQGPPSHFQQMTAAPMAIPFRGTAPPIQKAPFPPPPQIQQLPRIQQPPQAPVNQFPQQQVGQIPPVPQVQPVPAVPPVQNLAQGPEPSYQIRGGTTYFPPEAQPYPGGHGGGGSGGTTYFSPHDQQPSPPRVSVSRRPKAAIPIINPQQDYQTEYDYQYQYDESGAEIATPLGQVTDVSGSTLSANAQEFMTSLPPGADQENYDEEYEGELVDATNEDDQGTLSKPAADRSEQIEAEQFVDSGDVHRGETVVTCNDQEQSSEFHGKEEAMVSDSIGVSNTGHVEQTSVEGITEMGLDLELVSNVPDVVPVDPDCTTQEFAQSQEASTDDLEAPHSADSSPYDQTSHPEREDSNSPHEKSTSVVETASVDDSVDGPAPANQSKDEIMKEIKVVYTEAKES